MSDLQDIRTVPAADVSQRRFHDRVVTGAGDGIGAASTARFADEGAHVIVCDANDTAAVSVADNPTSRGLPAQARVFDVTDADVCLRSQNRPSASTRASTSWSTMPDSIAAAIYSHSATTIGRSLRGQRRCDVPPVPRGSSPHDRRRSRRDRQYRFAAGACTRRSGTSPTTCPRPPCCPSRRISPATTLPTTCA